MAKSNKAGMSKSCREILQSRMQSLLDRLVADGKEHGLQLAACVDGKLVLDIWAGLADTASGRPVDGETIFPVFSTTKGIVATIIHKLVEIGKLSYDSRISDYWPEFGSHGKERITIRQALNHSAGIPQMPENLSYEQLFDWDTMCSIIAAMPPLWPPGTNIEYHAMTQGWILGEVARRADGRDFKQLLNDMICRPLGLTSMFAGIPDDAQSRVAVLEESEAIPLSKTNRPISVPSFIWPVHILMNRPDARRACMPASNGIMNARSIALHYASLLPGGVDGVELLPPERIRIATEMQRPDNPKNDDWPKNWGLGYKINNCEFHGASLPAFGSVGYGGAFGWSYPDLKLAVGFAKNFFHIEDTSKVIMNELLDAVHQARSF